MNNRKIIPIILMIVLIAVLAAIVGVLAFQFGQQRSLAGLGSQMASTNPAGESPATTNTPLPPPSIVTNTPSSTPIPSPTAGPTDTPTPTPTDTPTPTPTPIVVITRINALGRLETAEFAMRTVIDLENDPESLWQQIVGTDQLMLIAEGEVVAGFDLEKIREEDIIVLGTSVQITLPPPEILYSRIDNERTYVYERKTGLLVSPDESLEGRARLLAEESITEWATQRGIYKKAEEQGRIYLENFLRSLGFTEITIETRPGDL